MHCTKWEKEKTSEYWPGVLECGAHQPTLIRLLGLASSGKMKFANFLYPTRHIQIKVIANQSKLRNSKNLFNGKKREITKKTKKEAARRNFIVWLANINSNRTHNSADWHRISANSITGHSLLLLHLICYIIKINYYRLEQ